MEDADLQTAAIKRTERWCRLMGWRSEEEGKENAKMVWVEERESDGLEGGNGIKGIQM